MSFEEIFAQLPRADQESIEKVMSLLEKNDHDTVEFAKAAHIKCKPNCGQCCEFPHVQTTVAETLPLAIYLWSTGQANQVWEKIGDNTDGKCVFFKSDPNRPGHGRCEVYSYRPGICRLFGFSAVKDKYGRTVLAACKVLKGENGEALQKVQEQIDQGLKVPISTDHFMQVFQSDPLNGRQMLSINDAVAKAIERIGLSINGRQQA